jgi:hypothetical protein
VLDHEVLDLRLLFREIEVAGCDDQPVALARRFRLQAGLEILIEPLLTREQRDADDFGRCGAVPRSGATRRQNQCGDRSDRRS